MAFYPKSHLLFFCLCIFFSLCLSFNPSHPNKVDVHDLLPLYNLPKGLLPNNVKSYTISPKDNSFTVQLTHPCYVQFKDQLVYYEKYIKGKMSYGKVSDVSGIQAKKVFVWVSVTGISVDEESHMIEFHVGFLSEKLPANEFEDIPTCKNKGCQDSSLASI
ncbi:uncharacterized protein LOC132040075 [Lycium ferocissimum]|uniref:uncharacterized protein LOC132040075 n=1 Tax=Lycium ferocissimum TaxID=112874 RepID=UPI00281576A4|nr:uncharacterized protein LOC132040075 [Lycium ferocissimum]